MGLLPPLSASGRAGGLSIKGDAFSTHQEDYVVSVYPGRSGVLVTDYVMVV